MEIIKKTVKKRGNEGGVINLPKEYIEKEILLMTEETFLSVKNQVVNNYYNHIKDYNIILKQCGLDDFYDYLLKKQVISIDDLCLAFGHQKTKTEILLNIGFLEGLGLITIKFDVPMKVIVFDKKDANDRYKKIIGED